MSATTTSAQELTSLKARLKAVWMSGDFDKIARIIEAGGAEFIARLQLTPGARVLDVACGTGNLSFPAARAGAIVTGVDIAPNLLATARVTPPPMPSPLLWGHEPAASERLRERFTNLRCARRELVMEFPMKPPDAVEFFRAWYGPTQRAFAALDEAGQAALRRDLERLWTENDLATDGSTRIAAEYLEVIATRA